MNSKNLCKAFALGLVTTLTVGVVGVNTISISASLLPSTDGHTTYVDSDVFSIIGSDTFGTVALNNPLFDQTNGSQDITDLQVPT